MSVLDEGHVMHTKLDIYVFSRKIMLPLTFKKIYCSHDVLGWMQLAINHIMVQYNDITSLSCNLAYAQ
jgi:hypothetical protein